MFTRRATKINDKVSRYLILSKTTYVDNTGTRVRLMYATRTAKLLFVTPTVAEALVSGNLKIIPPGISADLRSAQIIVSQDEDELAAVLDRNRSAAADRSSMHFMLLPTSYCNMGCTYCGQEHVRGSLTPHHRDLVRSRVLRAMRQTSIRSARIDWFGAEPMMGYAVMRNLAPDFVHVADERGIRYDSTIVTNGSLLNARNIDVLIRRCRVNRFAITLDGPPEVHDIHRPLKKGTGSFHYITNILQQAIAHPDYQRVQFDFRTNVDVHNADSIGRYVDIMADMGFTRSNVTFSLSRVRPWSNDVSAVEVTGEDFAQRELAWLAQMQQRGLNFMHVPTVAKQVTCPAVKATAELISGTGNIFSCTDHPLVPESERTAALAHIGDSELTVFRPKGEFDDWHDEVADGKPGCSNCVFLPTCGGSCPKAWREGHPPCPSYKLNIQGRLDLIAERCGMKPEWIDK